MAKPVTGVAVPNVAEAANKSWYRFKHFNAGSSTDPRICYVSGYHRAVADLMVDQFQFGGWDTLTRRLLEVFEYLADEREAVRIDAEDPSYEDDA